MTAFSWAYSSLFRRGAASLQNLHYFSFHASKWSGDASQGRYDTIQLQG